MENRQSHRDSLWKEYCRNDPRDDPHCQPCRSHWSWWSTCGSCTCRSLWCCCRRGNKLQIADIHSYLKNSESPCISMYGEFVITDAVFCACVPPQVWCPVFWKPGLHEQKESVPLATQWASSPSPHCVLLLRQSFSLVSEHENTRQACQQLWIQVINDYQYC